MTKDDNQTAKFSKVQFFTEQQPTTSSEGQRQYQQDRQLVINYIDKHIGIGTTLGDQIEKRHKEYIRNKERLTDTTHKGSITAVAAAKVIDNESREDNAKIQKLYGLIEAKPSILDPIKINKLLKEIIDRQDDHIKLLTHPISNLRHVLTNRSELKNINKGITLASQEETANYFKDIAEVAKQMAKNNVKPSREHFKTAIPSSVPRSAKPNISTHRNR